MKIAARVVLTSGTESDVHDVSRSLPPVAIATYMYWEHQRSVMFVSWSILRDGLSVVDHELENAPVAGIVECRLFFALFQSLWKAFQCHDDVGLRYLSWKDSTFSVVSHLMTSLMVRRLQFDCL